MCKCQSGDWSVLKLTDNADYELKPALLTQVLAGCRFCNRVYRVDRDVTGKVSGIEEISIFWSKTNTIPVSTGGSA